MTDAAQKIAERVTLPEPHESAVVCLTPEGYAHGNMLDVQLQVLQGTRLRRGDVLYTTAQMEALRLAVAAEAVRGAEAVATVESWTNGSYHRNYKIAWHRDVPEGAKLYTTPPAGSVEVTDAMVTGLLREYLRLEPSEVGIVEIDDPVSREFARGLLTAALQEPK